MPFSIKTSLRAEAKTRVMDVLIAIDALGDCGAFMSKEDGDSLLAIFVAFNSFVPGAHLKPRTICSKATKKLSMDIMLPFQQLISVDDSERRRVHRETLYWDVALNVAKYKFPNFDVRAFLNDLKEWIESWTEILPGSRFSSKGINAKGTLGLS